MLTEEKLNQWEKFNEEDSGLSYASTSILIDEVRALQQQNKRLIDSIIRANTAESDDVAQEILLNAIRREITA